MVSSRNANAHAYSLWSLLPSFCNYPSDTAKSFIDIEEHLRIKLKEELDIRGIFCPSLQLLIRQNKNIKDSNDKDIIGQDMAKENILVNYLQQVTTENLKALELSAKNLLRDLSEVFLKSIKYDDGCLQDVSVMQKKAYKVLSIILRSSDSFVSSKLEYLLKLMVKIHPCHTSSKRHRLDCIYFLIVHVLKSEAVKVQLLDFLTVHDSKSKDDSKISLKVFLTEIILALKEANKKTRNMAYDILISDNFIREFFLRNCIIDKNVKIRRNVIITNADGVDKVDKTKEGFYIRSDITVILKNATIKDGTVI